MQCLGPALNGKYCYKTIQLDVFPQVIVSSAPMMLCLSSTAQVDTLLRLRPRGPCDGGVQRCGTRLWYQRV